MANQLPTEEVVSCSASYLDKLPNEILGQIGKLYDQNKKTTDRSFNNVFSELAIAPNPNTQKLNFLIANLEEATNLKQKISLIAENADFLSEHPNFLIKVRKSLIERNFLENFEQNFPTILKNIKNYSEATLHTLKFLFMCLPTKRNTESFNKDIYDSLIADPRWVEMGKCLIRKDGFKNQVRRSNVIINNTKIMNKIQEKYMMNQGRKKFGLLEVKGRVTCGINCFWVTVAPKKIITPKQFLLHKSTETEKVFNYGPKDNTYAKHFFLELANYADNIIPKINGVIKNSRIESIFRTNDSCTKKFKKTWEFYIKPSILHKHAHISEVKDMLKSLPDNASAGDCYDALTTLIMKCEEKPNYNPNGTFAILAEELLVKISPEMRTEYLAKQKNLQVCVH